MSNSNINVAVVGMGNCAKSLIEGTVLYSNNPKMDSGLAFRDVGGYLPNHIRFVLGFDADIRKVSTGLVEALYTPPNCAMNLISDRELTESDQVSTEARVLQSPCLDGFGPMCTVLSKLVTDPDGNFKSEQYYSFQEHEDGSFHTTHLPDFDPFEYEDGFIADYDHFVATRKLGAGGWDQEVANYAEMLEEAEVDVLVNYLPVGSAVATEFWAEVCLKADVAMVNCIPEFIASDRVYAGKFVDAGIPIVGDDMRSQFGASIVSAVLQDLLISRGFEVDMHYQDNIGGNMDFYNMQDKNRLKSKKISKENVIRNQNKLAGIETKPNSVAAGPAEFFSSLNDNKRAHWLIRGKGFGGAPFEFTADLSVQDSPNSGGVVIDAIRLVQTARDLGIVGPLVGPSAWTQKTPPLDMRPGDAYEECKCWRKVISRTDMSNTKGKSLMKMF